MITMRHVMNWSHGLGLSWDGVHRIQAFTHPSWFLLVSAAFSLTGELFYTVLSVSILAILCSVALGLRIAIQTHTPWRSLGFLATLLASSSFIDYSTSGLENALTTLLLGVLFSIIRTANAVATRFQIVVLGVTGALLLLNRLDLILLIGPLALVFSLKTIGLNRALLGLVPGLLILLIWFSFATAYFGTPLPNTYYAKLHTGYPSSEYWTRGLTYFWVCCTADPVGCTLIIGGIVSGLVGTPARKAISIGALFYCVYIAKVGGIS